MPATGWLSVIRFEFSVDVDRSPSDVFAYVTDADRLPEWQSGVVEAVWQGPKAEGARIREVRKFLGRRLDIEQEVTAYEPGRRFALRAVSGPFPLSASIVLEPHGDGTTVTFGGEADPARFFKLAEPIVARAAKRQIKNDLEALKALLERDRGS